MRLLALTFLASAACAGAPPSPPVTSPPVAAAPAAVDAGATPDPLRALLERCDEVGVEIDDLTPLPDAIELDLGDDERLAIARVIREHEVAKYSEREGKIEGAALDAWIDEGAPMQVLQAVRTVDPARQGGDDLAWIVVLQYEHARWGTMVAFVGRSAAGAWLPILEGNEPADRAVALGDRDGDGWTDVLLLRPRRDGAIALWWITSRPREEVRWERNRIGGQHQVGRRDHLMLGVFPDCV